jgi:hypothetical protein
MRVKYFLESHLVTIGRGAAITGLNKSTDIEVRVFAAKRMSEVDRDVPARHGVVDVLDDFSDKLEMLAGQCPLLCLGHLNNRNGRTRVKDLFQSYQVLGEVASQWPV